ncbi:MAG: MmcQ/YjbR family DNA-binding protein [Clostridiales bacterium]|nr:MmcQ/YjbR family DNA-binding protein [Clostridiales bacterium]
MTLHELTEYIFVTYSAEPEHPFKMDDVSSVFRHIGNRKWFALTMNVPYRTLGMAKDGRVDILNVKCDPILIGSLRFKPGFRPAYHMNKDKWITVLLDGSARRDEIEVLVAISYDLTKPKLISRRQIAKSSQD